MPPEPSSHDGRQGDGSKGWIRVTASRHIVRVGLLMATAAILLGWVISHTQATFADGLRYIHRAERIERDGVWTNLASGIDHPLHPLAIAATHRLLGGHDPDSWQRAALTLSFACGVFLIVPVYLLTLELLGERSAWMACVLVMVNPIIGYIVVNVLSECTFLVPWMFGLWCAVRFLRDGRFIWLPPAVALSAAAYLTRPEGMLLAIALVLTLLVIPMLKSTHIHWPRWWAAMGFLMGGLLLLAGPYVALKGGLGTKPGIARVLGLAPGADALALEREKPVPEGQTTFERYATSGIRAIKAFRGAVTPPLFPFAILGILVAWWIPDRARSWLFLSIMLVASWAALTRLHAIAGYCTIRHGLVPGLILTLAAAHGTTWLMGKISLPGRFLGLGQERFRPGPAVWALLIGLGIVVPNLRALGPLNPGPFEVYEQAGTWIAEHARNGEQILDLTDWTVFFSKRPGYVFADVYSAPADPTTRWVVVRKPHIDGHWHYSKVIRELIGDRRPVAVLPASADPRQVQIRVYDRLAPDTAIAGALGARRPEQASR